MCDLVSDQHGQLGVAQAQVLGVGAPDQQAPAGHATGPFARLVGGMDFPRPGSGGGLLARGLPDQRGGDAPGARQKGGIGVEPVPALEGVDALAVQLSRAGHHLGLGHGLCQAAGEDQQQAGEAHGAGQSIHCTSIAA